MKKTKTMKWLLPGVIFIAVIYVAYFFVELPETTPLMNVDSWHLVETSHNSLSDFTNDIIRFSFISPTRLQYANSGCIIDIPYQANKEGLISVGGFYIDSVASTRICNDVDGSFFMYISLLSNYEIVGDSLLLTDHKKWMLLRADHAK